MLKERERWILFCDIVLKPSPENAPFMPMGEGVESLLERQQTGDSYKLLDNDNAAIRITDMSIDNENQIANLLIQYADKSVADPAFGNLETGVLRFEPKLDGEGIAVSAHMAISLVPRTPRSNIYLTLIEDVPGITRSRIAPFLTSEFKHSCDFMFRDENGQNNRCRPLVTVVSHASQTLREELRRGQLNSIDLIKLDYQEPRFDEQGYTREISRHIKLRLSRAYLGEAALGVIEQVRIKALQEGYNELRVRYKRYEGKQVTAPIDDVRENASDKLFARLELARFQNPLSQCLEQLEVAMVNKMSTFIIEERNQQQQGG